MLMAPLPERRVRAVRTSRVEQVANLSDEQEADAFMAFLGEHSQFAATHKGA